MDLSLRSSTLARRQYNRGDYLWQMSKAVTTDNVFAVYHCRRRAAINVIGYFGLEA